jgi:hypothetical protein
MTPKAMMPQPEDFDDKSEYKKAVYDGGSYPMDMKLEAKWREAHDRKLRDVHKAALKGYPGSIKEYIDE